MSEAHPSGKLAMWVIYDHPKDYPHGFIARQWLVGETPEPTQEVIRGATLEEIRTTMERFGLVRLARNDEDDACIVETWL